MRLGGLAGICMFFPELSPLDVVLKAIFSSGNWQA